MNFLRPTRYSTSRNGLPHSLETQCRRRIDRERGCRFGVVIQLAPLFRLGQLPAFEADGVNDTVASRSFSSNSALETQHRSNPSGCTAVDIFPGPVRRPAFEAGVVEKYPVIQIDGVSQWAAVEVDHLLDRKTQECGKTIMTSAMNRRPRSWHPSAASFGEFSGPERLHRNFFQLGILSFVGSAPTARSLFGTQLLCSRFDSPLPSFQNRAFASF